MRAARREPVERTPVWFMRQAGRVLPEYRAIRERWTLIEICRQPDLCAEVTLQPVHRFDPDAAIMFADIMLPLLGSGVALELVDEVGPVIASPIRDLAGVRALRPLEPEADVSFVLDAIRLVRQALDGAIPLIGFSGAPFTLASYLIEGKPSRDFAHTKAMMYGAPELWHALMQRLADLVIAYLDAQVRHGVDALQLFDSWVGCLAPDDYAQYVAPYTRRVFAALAPAGLPMIHFGTGTSTLLSQMKDDGASIIGVDWRLPLDDAWDRIAPLGIQGNLDPAVLLAPAVSDRSARARRAAPRRRAAWTHFQSWSRSPAVDADRVSSLRDRRGTGKRIRGNPGGQDHDGWFGMTDQRHGVLLMAYGSPDSVEQVAPYFTHIRGGRAPSPEAIANLEARYRSVGGRTPLLAITQAVRVALEEELARDNGAKTRVFAGMKHWHPFIAETIGEMASAGITSATAIALAPHYSRMSIGGYRRAVDEALAAIGHPFSVTFVSSWHREAEFIAMMEELVRNALMALAREENGRVMTVFTHIPFPSAFASGTIPTNASLPRARRPWRGAQGCGSGGWPGRARAAPARRGLAPTSSSACRRCSARAFGTCFRCRSGLSPSISRFSSTSISRRSGRPRGWG